jgi:hypothetical protein
LIGLYDRELCQWGSSTKFLMQRVIVTTRQDTKQLRHVFIFEQGQMACFPLQLVVVCAHVSLLRYLSVGSE